MTKNNTIGRGFVGVEKSFEEVSMNSQMLERKVEGRDDAGQTI